MTKIQINSKAFRAQAIGTVQGVSFRDFVKRHADQLDIVGYVRNLPDGSVEIVAEGEKINLTELLERVKQGPSSAFVEEVVEEWVEPLEEYVDFSVR